MTLKIKFKGKERPFIVESTKTGLSAYNSKESIFTTGKNMEELEKNIKQALELSHDKE